MANKFEPEKGGKAACDMSTPRWKTKPLSECGIVKGILEPNDCVRLVLYTGDQGFGPHAYFTCIAPCSPEDLLNYKVNRISRNFLSVGPFPRSDTFLDVETKLLTLEPAIVLEFWDHMTQYFGFRMLSNTQKARLLLQPETAGSLHQETP